MSAFCLGASAENVGDTITTSDLRYLVTGSSTVEVLNEVNSSNTLYTIPEMVAGTDGNDYTVTAIGEYAFRWSNVTTVTLPSTITEIKASAFSSSELTSINLPEGLKNIRDNAFSGCSNMKSIEIPASVDSIGNGAFFGSSWQEDMTSITFNEGLKYIGEGAFYSQDFTEISLPASLEEIGNTAFLMNRKLTKVTIAEGVKKFGDGVFNGCSSLSDITLPNSLEEVGIETFFNDKALTKINIPANLTKIGESFIAGTSVETIDLSNDNTAFVMKDGVVYSSDYKILYLSPVIGITDLTVDDRCLGINGGAFFGSALKSIKLPETLVAIGYAAFEGSQLDSINWPKNLVDIETEAFANTQFTEVKLPDNINYINDAVFSGCKNLTKVTIPSGVKEVYAHAFSNCTSLSSVVAEGSVAPAIMDYYDDYEAPFYNIGSSAILTVPFGAKDSYSDAGYDVFFTVNESSTGTLVAKSVTPASGDTLLAKYQPLSFDITFSLPVEIVNASPAVRIQEGDGGSGSALYSFSSTFIEPTEGATWHVTDNSSDHKTITVWADDGYMEGTDTFNPDCDTTFYVYIPSKIVKQAIGNAYNEQLTLFYNGPVSTDGISAVAVNGKQAGIAKVVARYNLNGQQVSASQKGVQIVRFSDGTSRKVIVR